MRGRPRIGLLIQSSTEYGRDLLRGVGRYIAEHGTWVVYHRAGPLLDRLPPDFNSWRPDAILAQLESGRLVRQIRALRLPTVDLFAKHRLPGIPRVIPDHGAVSRLVANYFLERGYEHFAYCGFRGVYYSDLRRDEFAGYLARRSYATDIYEGVPVRRRKGVLAAEAAGLMESPQLGRWLRSLPKPVALMAATDVRAHQVLSACGECGIAVPDEVAVAGVGNDQVIYRLCEPQLTSVDLNTEEIGYRAAALLDRMMRRRRGTIASLVRVAPRGIVTRQSTHAVAAADPKVAAAMIFIRDHCDEPISVEDVVARVALSRSTLQRRFQRSLGHTLQREIHLQRIHRIKGLLSDTDMPLARVAEAAGFDHLETMCRLFKRYTGSTAGAYRNERRRGRAAAAVGVEGH